MSTAHSRKPVRACRLAAWSLAYNELRHADGSTGHVRGQRSPQGFVAGAVMVVVADDASG
ncbi:hypothetical protein STANM309S_05064 [Streptomyces tanashiensis]